MEIKTKQIDPGSKPFLSVTLEASISASPLVIDVVTDFDAKITCSWMRECIQDSTKKELV
jgi:hypothetical protein